MNYNFTHAPIATGVYDKCMRKLLPVMKRAENPSYDNEFAMLSVLEDYDLINRSGALAKHFEDCELLVLVGIGGSNLGTMAVAEAVLGKHYQLKNTPQILFADTVDPAYTQEIISLVQHAIDAKKQVVINAVSKSGTTTETVALLTVFVEVMKQVPEYRDYIVITTDKGSKLWNTARQEGYHLLEIPKRIGGRYSVFSPVGLFPLALLGIDIQEFIKGAVAAKSYCLRENKKNPAALGAIALWHYNKKGKNIHDTFLFAQQLEGIGRWYRQLLAESCGKERNTKNKVVHAGITPTVSIGSVDLHSMGQLYIDGPADKITTFVSVEHQEALFIPLNKGLSLLVDDIQNRQMKEVLDAIHGGVNATYAKQKIPFIDVTIPNCSEKSIGEFLQMKMFETIYLAALLEVDPFDQPAVEKYKSVTRELLRKASTT